MNTEITHQPPLTKQRQLVYDHLDNADEFVSAQQVHVALRNEGEAIGLATVYRALQWLSEARMVDTIRSNEGEAIYRRCSPVHHHHLICKVCGRAVEVAGDALEDWSRQVAAAHGYREPDHYAEIYGICPNC